MLFRANATKSLNYTNLVLQIAEMGRLLFNLQIYIVQLFNQLLIPRFRFFRHMRERDFIIHDDVGSFEGAIFHLVGKSFCFLIAQLMSKLIQ